jgi:hypothetical protein
MLLFDSGRRARCASASLASVECCLPLLPITTMHPTILTMHLATIVVLFADAERYQRTPVKSGTPFAAVNFSKMASSSLDVAALGNVM